MRTLEIPDAAAGDNASLAAVAQLATLLGTYLRGFTLLIEPTDEKAPNVPNPIIYFRLVVSPSYLVNMVILEPSGLPRSP